MSNKIADFFAEIGIKADISKLTQLDKKLADLERGLHNFEVTANKASKNVTRSLAKSISKGTKEIGKQRAEVEKTTEAFWKQAEVGKKASEISERYFKKLENQARLTARFQKQAQSLGNAYEKKTGFGRLSQVEKSAKQRSASVGDNRRDFYQLKEAIRARLSSNTNVAAAGRFGNLAFAENRMAKERAEQAAKAIADEKQRAQYLKKAQQEYAREASRIEKARVRAAERAEAAAKREENSNRRIEAIAKRTAAIKEAGEKKAAAVREAAVIKAQAMERAALHRNRVGRPSNGILSSGAVGGAIGAGMSSLSAFLPGVGAGYALVQANRLNQEIMGQKMALTAVTGSEKAGEEALQRLKSMANEVGFSWKETASPFARMIASGKTAGMAQTDVEQIFRSTTEYGRVMGLSGDDMKGSLRAIEQMMNKEQVMAEELKMQLGDRMPAVVGMMAEAVSNKEGRTVTSKELMKMMQEGKVSSEYLVEFAKIMSKRAREGGALEKAMQSSAAQQERFNNQFSTLVEVAGKNGLEGGFVRIWKALADALGDVNDSGVTLGKMFERISYIIQGVLGGIKTLGRGFDYLADTIGISKEALAMIAGAVGVALLPFGKLVLVATALSMVFDDLSRWSNGEDSLFKDLFESLDPATQESFSKLAESMKALVNNLIEVGKMSFDGWKQLFGWFSDSGGADIVINRMTNMTDAIGKLLETILKMKDGDWKGALDSINDAAFSSFKASFGVINDISNMDRNRAMREYAQSGHEILPKIARENQGLTGEQLRERVEAIAKAGQNKNVQFNFGDINLELNAGSSLDPMDLSVYQNQVSEWFKGEITKAGMQFTENRQE
jgi:tape measure domain-containing protein